MIASAPMPLCEVRVTTYKRPDLLIRALKSLQSQSYPHWKAVVLDDSPEQEGRQTVLDLGDERVLYRPNSQNLGRNDNIDLAFQSKAMVGGRYAFVLEDDNYLFPDFIESNIKSLQAHDVSIVLRNQEIRIESSTGSSTPTGETTRGNWFVEKVYSPLDLYATLFFCEGISNGGLFWDTAEIKSDLIVGKCIDDSWFQEIFRTLKIVEPVFFNPAVGSVWTQFEVMGADRGSKLPSLLSTPPVNNRATQAILRHLIEICGDSLIERAQAIASGDCEKTQLLERQILNALQFSYPYQHVSMPKRLIILAKHYIRHLYSADRFQSALRSMPLEKSLGIAPASLG